MASGELPPPSRSSAGKFTMFGLRDSRYVSHHEDFPLETPPSSLTEVPVFGVRRRSRTKHDLSPERQKNLLEDIKGGADLTTCALKGLSTRSVKVVIPEDSSATIASFSRAVGSGVLRIPRQPDTNPLGVALGSRKGQSPDRRSLSRRRYSAPQGSDEVESSEVATFTMGKPNSERKLSLTGEGNDLFPIKPVGPQATAHQQKLGFSLMGLIGRANFGTEGLDSKPPADSALEDAEQTGASQQSKGLVRRNSLTDLAPKKPLLGGLARPMSVGKNMDRMVTAEPPSSVDVDQPDSAAPAPGWSIWERTRSWVFGEPKKVDVTTKDLNVFAPTSF